MANIMMTDVCNLHCPYCFANEFVNKDSNEITEENFDKAVDFIVGDGSTSTVGLIGGEPTTHRNFDHLMRKLLTDRRVETVMVYTNGILMDRFWDVLCHQKTHMLINCNPPKDMGESQYQHLCENLKVLIEDKLCADRITLGINMYEENFEYGYIVDLLKRFHLHRVRVSITVPNAADGRQMDVHGYFRRMKLRMFEFFHELLSHEIIPNFDCNKIPSCLVSRQELEQFNVYLENPYIKANIGRSNIVSDMVQCTPVIDIRQDLTAVRCFGLSDCTKQPISKFKGIMELKNYYLRTVDAWAYNSVYTGECIDCHLREVMKCSGGCMAYKACQIRKLSEMAEEQMKAMKMPDMAAEQMKAMKIPDTAAEQMESIR